jgi:hypothetical protein
MSFQEVPEMSDGGEGSEVGRGQTLSISILQVVACEKRNPIVARSLVSAGGVRHRCGCVSDASVAMAMAVFGAGCASGWNALSRAGVHSSVFYLL